MSIVKMADVALAAEVSVSTVGRYFNNGYVCQEKCNRIERAVEELGYIPNKTARGFKTRKSGLIGNMMFFNENQLYGKIAGSIEKSALQRGYNVFALTVYNRDDSRAILDEFISRGVEGIIITSNQGLCEEDVRKIVRNRVPVVMLERSFHLPGTDSLLVDDFAGAYGAVNSLIAKGRRRIAYVGVRNFGSPVEDERKNGYQRALEDAGMVNEDEMMAFMDVYSVENGYIAAESLFAHDRKPDALFCASDILAAGGLQYCYQHGLQIPDDLSIVGYDDTVVELLAPKISSVGWNLKEIGEKAIELICSKLENPEREDRTIVTDMVFSDRNS